MIWNWYDDENKLVHIATYDDARAASYDAERAARKGWVPQGSSATEGHVNVGRTTLKVLALGLPFLVTGASRTKGKLTITYVRTPEWLANRQRRLEAKAQAEAARKAERETAKTEQRAEAERRRAEAESARANQRALQGLKRGHVERDQPTYGRPDIFAKPTGVLAPGAVFDLVEMRGTFARVRPAAGADVWIALSAIRPGELETPPATMTRPPDPRAAPAIERQARFCEQCGGRVSEAAKFCGSCGAPVLSVGQEEGSFARPMDATAPPPGDQRSGEFDASTGPDSARPGERLNEEKDTTTIAAADHEQGPLQHVADETRPEAPPLAPVPDETPGAPAATTLAAAASAPLSFGAQTATSNEASAATADASMDYSWLRRPPVWFKAFIVGIGVFAVAAWFGLFASGFLVLVVFVIVSRARRNRLLALLRPSESRAALGAARGRVQIAWSSARTWWRGRPGAVKIAYATIGLLSGTFVLAFAFAGLSRTGEAAPSFFVALATLGLLLALGLFGLSLIAWIPLLGPRLLRWLGWDDIPRLRQYRGLQASLALLVIAAAIFGTAVVAGVCHIGTDG